MEDKNLVVIADYGVGDPAFTEVMLQLRLRLPNVFIMPQSTPPFSTLNTGFWIHQIARTPNVKDTFIYSNTAPRKHDASEQKNNRGEEFMYAKLNNDFEILAVNAGYCFSFVKPHIVKFHYANVENEGSQFRSRDKFPGAVAKMVKGDTSFIGEKADVDLIPDYPNNRIASIDGYGNIKTTTKLAEIDIQPGTRCMIEVNKKRHVATFSDSFFNIKEGALGFVPGSSGHRHRFMEIAWRGASAWELFGKPFVEQKFSFSF